MSSKGNALFLILIAVALFAALSYAITSSGRGGGNISKEQNQIAAAQVIEYGQIIKTAVDRMRIINGCREDQITFEGNALIMNGSGAAYNLTNSSAPIDERCHVFSNSGGGVVKQLLPDIASVPPEDVDGSWSHSQTVLPATHRILGVGQDGNADLILLMGRLRKDICIEINNKLGIDNPSGSPPVDTYLNTSFYTGSYPTGAVIGDDATGLVGQTSFCNKNSNADEFRYTYHIVLIAR